VALYFDQQREACMLNCLLERRSIAPLAITHCIGMAEIGGSLQTMT